VVGNSNGLLKMRLGTSSKDSPSRRTPSHGPRHKCVLHACKHHEIHFMDSSTMWNFHHVSRHAMLWFLAPEWAHQLLDAVLNAFTERPWDTEAFFIIPRVFQRDWGRVSKQIMEMGHYAATTVPDYGSNTDIPCIILHLPCYVHSLPTPRWMDQPS
jgi:hypothetical protein